MTDDLKPIILDEYPINEDGASINLWVTQGDTVAAVRLSNQYSLYDQQEEQEELDRQGNGETAPAEIVIETYWNEDDLHAMAMTCIRALAATGQTKILATLVSQASTALAGSIA
jgi:hypothetical protein